ncbi:MAG: two-component system sensor histidine kinase NtrB [Candidatus Zixiibacteriota bacterium]
MLKTVNKFESKIHIGLLLIIFLLLFLHFISNYTIYRARHSGSEEVYVQLKSAALSISRIVQNNYPEAIDDDQLKRLVNEYNLSSLQIIPSRPSDTTLTAKRRWLMNVVRSLPPGQIPDIAEKILKADYNEVTRGKGSEYFFVYPIPARAGHQLLILSVNRGGLAYLDDSGYIIMGIVAVSLLLVTFLYLLISKTIFTPYRKITEKAVEAGRPVKRGDNEIEAVVADYEKIIEELKQSQAELLKLNRQIQNRADSLEQFNRYLLESINSGIVTLDAEGRVVSVNRAGCRILGIEPERYLKHHYVELFKDEEPLNGILAAALGEGIVEGYQEFNFTSENGRSLVLGITVSLITDQDKKQVGVSILINDLTEITRLRGELETKHRLAALGEMAGGLAHQLRNSMGAILGYSHLLKKKLKDADESAGSIAALVQETKEAEQLIEQFLNFTRPFNYLPVETAVDAMLEELLESFRVRDNCQKMVFERVGAAGVSIFADALLLKQALANIIDNACNAYVNREGTVKIHTAIDGSCLSVAVEDFGCGISEENMDKIFTPFYSSRPQGTGLGLPLAGKIIDLHRGRLSIKSQPGQGTVFTVILPLAHTCHDQPKRKLSASI